VIAGSKITEDRPITTLVRHRSVGRRQAMRAWFRTGLGVGLISLSVFALLVVGFTPYVEPNLLSREDPVERVAPAAVQESADDLSAAAERAALEKDLLTAKAEVAEKTAAEKAAAEKAAQANAAVVRSVQGEVAQRASDSASASASATSGAVPSDGTMYLTVPKIGLYDIPVYEGTSEASLSGGTGHMTGTGYPWVPGSNTYIAGHRIGYPGTLSDRVFWNLPSLAVGDQVIVEDSLGQSYTYQVSEVLEVPITDLSVTAPVGRDVVSLQTCIENYGDYWTAGPNWFVRYVVRADLVA
jgi:LPXTG-site transpeptidase (sortase) family protein